PEPGVVPETTLADATPAKVRGALLRNGCLLIRDVVPRKAAEELARDIERAYEIRLAVSEQRSNGEAKGWYEEFEPDSPYISTVNREWIDTGGGLLAADSPVMHAKMLAAFSDAGLNDLIAGYLGEPAAISDQKCTLRKTPPSAGRGWHQDGSFMGDVKALNVWMALTHCGDDAPGMDIVPKRIDEILPSGTEGTDIAIQIHEDIARKAAGPDGVVRPVFEPGDVLLFDEMFLHTTAADPAMPNTRYAIESWFFGASAFPEDYVPIAA
ncbi:MAG: phytanoyl-CoA dioxygenase family protein, partial [bacterium]